MKFDVNLFNGRQNLRNLKEAVGRQFKFKGIKIEERYNSKKNSTYKFCYLFTSIGNFCTTDFSIVKDLEYLNDYTMIELSNFNFVVEEYEDNGFKNLKLKAFEI